MSSPVDVSFVLTVYNKAPFLPATLASLRAQAGELVYEYVFVDDASTDASVEVIIRETAGWDRVVLVRNSENLGPSIRLNQGITASSGACLLMLDADDRLVQGAAYGMWSLLRREQAEIVYGRWKKMHRSDEAEPLWPREPSYHVSEEPLPYVLQGRFVRMCVMAEKAVCERAGGADPRLFIQDESLPLRLARHATRFIAVDAPVVCVPPASGALSHYKPQQHHDRFFAYYYAVEEWLDLRPEVRQQLYRRAVSSAWKYVRGAYRWPYGSWIFWYYVAVQLGSLAPSPSVLQRLRALFERVEPIRRCASSSSIKNPLRNA